MPYLTQLEYALGLHYADAALDREWGQELWPGQHGHGVQLNGKREPNLPDIEWVHTMRYRMTGTPDYHRCRIASLNSG